MRVGLAGWFHLFFFGGFLPCLAFRSSRRLETGTLPPKLAFLQSQVVMLTVFLALSILIAKREWIVLWPSTIPEPNMFVLGAAMLVCLVTLMRPFWRKRVEERERKVWLFMPQTRAERFWWIACSVAAGVSEEVTYRGVMFALLWRVTDSAAVAALIGATVFAVSHVLQGFRSMAIIFGFALAFQLIAWLSGSLYVSMAVHALYDVAAGLCYGYYGEKLGYPVEPMPA